MQDRYLQYGAIARRRAEALAAYADHKAQCLAGLTNRRDSAIKEMSAVIESIRTAEYELRLAVEGRDRLHRNYRAFLNHLGDSHTRLLQRYREANLQSRSTPAPARFQRRPELPAFLNESTQDVPLHLGESERAHVIERMEHFIKAVNQQFETEVEKYQTIARLTQLHGTQHVNA